MHTSTLLPVVLATASTFFEVTIANNGGAYALKDDMSYRNFFESFDFFSGPDPTKGFVQYQTLESAVQNQYVGYFEDQKSVYLGVDYKNKDPKGRASVRLESKKTWNQGLLIADIAHMPDSTCGSWPAFWALGVGPDPAKPIEWPNAGEVDILEGVNDNDAAAVTLHTSAGCAVENATTSSQGQTDAQSAFTGSMVTDDCDVAAPGQDKNQGCSVKAPETKGLSTYGTKFNSAGGGVYAMEWTEEAISVWFVPRNSSVYLSTFSPSSSSSNTTSNSTASLDPSTFGAPLAKFSGSGCDFTKRFQDLKIIFNTAFCGEWAGRQEVWDSSCKTSTGAATCQEYVQNNPEKFADAYWEIAGLKWYEKTSDNDKVKRAPLNVRQRGREYRW